MKGFIFSRFADLDLDEIAEYIRSLPEEPGLHLARDLRRTLNSIAEQPLLGPIDSLVSESCHCRVRRRVCHDYLVFYLVEGNRAEIIGRVHGKRDIGSVMAGRAG